MNKVISINLGGLVFNVDEEAYEKLRAYLLRVKQHFRNTEGRDEIITDIETRLAEMFTARLTGGRQVVNMQDVDSAIAIMGQPSEFEDGIEEQAAGARSSAGYAEGQGVGTSQVPPIAGTVRRRLFRDGDNAVLGGVCAGLSSYIDIDRVWIRLAFVLFVITFGTGILLYIILWLIIPKARTTADKLEMRGESVNIDNIKKSVETELRETKDNLQRYGQNFRDDRVGENIRKIVGVIIKVFVAAVLALVAASMFAGLFSVILIVFGVMPETNFPQFFNSPWEHILAGVGLILFIGIPLMVLIMALLRMVFKIKAKNRFVGPVLGGIWGLSIVLLGYTVFVLARDFHAEESLKTESELTDFQSDTLQLKLMNDGSFTHGESKHGIIRYEGSQFVKGNHVLLPTVHLDIQPSRDSSFRIEQETSAHGSSHEEALHHARSVEYGFKKTGNELVLDPNLKYLNGQPWRDQSVHLTLYVPYGKTVYLDPSLHKVLFDVDNVEKVYDRDMVSRHWKMTKRGLHCLDCNGNEFNFRHDDYRDRHHYRNDKHEDTNIDES